MPSEHDVDIDAVADAVVERLDPGTVINDKVVLSRRQALALASGTVGLGALATLGVGEASAQAAGQVGTSSEPVDVEAYDVNVANSLSTEVLNNISYFPPQRTSRTNEVDDSTPTNSYTTATLSTPPSDASIAIIEVISVGDGSSALQTIQVRENGTTRNSDLEARGWAGHGIGDALAYGWVPMDENNQIEYDTLNSAQALIATVGYL